MSYKVIDFVDDLYGNISIYPQSISSKQNEKVTTSLSNFIERLIPKKKKNSFHKTNLGDDRIFIFAADVRLRVFGGQHGIGDHEKVGKILGGVGPEHELVHRESGVR